MPSPMIKSFAEKGNKSVKKVEQYYHIAKKQALEKFESEESKGYWAYVTAILKNMLKINEESSTLLQNLQYINECKEIET